MEFTSFLSSRSLPHFLSPRPLSHTPLGALARRRFSFLPGTPPHPRRSPAASLGKRAAPHRFSVLGCRVHTARPPPPSLSVPPRPPLTPPPSATRRPSSDRSSKMGRCAWFDHCQRNVEHSGGLGASSAVGESAGAENEAFSQDWFEEDFGLNSRLREVEEIQLQRLQIEREIEQLQLAQAKEQQQRQYPYNFYIREIPNKPPPPYTPPEETPRISASIAGSISPLGTPRDPSPRAAIPTDQEEVANFIRAAAGQFFDAWNQGECLDSVEPPPSLKFVPEEEEAYTSEVGVDGDMRKKSGRAYSHFLFDLSRQLVDESLDNVEGEKWVSVPTKFGSRKLKPALPLPIRERFAEELVKQALVILGFIPRDTRDNFMFSWTLKKRDHIDEILMREVQEEDRYWTNFDEEERYLKEQIAESLFELLLADTTKAVSVAYERRERGFLIVDD